MTDTFIHFGCLRGSPAYYHTLARAGAEAAHSKGFEPATWDNLPAKLLFVITELDEAADFTTDANLAEELADTAIRLLGALHDLTRGKWCSRIQTRRQRWDAPRRHASLPDHLWPVVAEVSKAAEEWRKGRVSDTAMRMELALLEVWRAADRLGVDLDAEVEAKIVKNRTRPHLHGKASTVG